MSCKDSAGRVYIRAYRNRWDAQKKRSCVDARIQVGRLLDDGSIRLSSAFEQAFSSFQGQTWYWADRELVSQQQFEQLFPVKRERQKFCVHGIIGARQTGASNEHEHQTQFS